MVVGFIWASHGCHSLDFEIVREFQVDLVFPAVGAFGGELSLFLFLLFLVVDDRSAVAGTAMYLPLTSFPARVQQDGEFMEHFPF
jgi:hypothetical protein